MRIGKPKTVFARAFLVLLLSGLAVEGVVMALMTSLSPTLSPSDMMFANLDLYLRLTAEELARHPSAAIAEKMLSNTRFDVRAEGAFHWHTSGVGPAANRGLASNTLPNGRIIRFENDRPVFSFPVTTPQGPVTFSFLGPPRPPLESPQARFAIFASILLVVFTVASLAVRRILRPIGVLTSALDAVKLGKMNTSVPSEGEDELSLLSRSFNEMASGIRFLIKDKEQLFTELSHEFRAPIARVFAANSLVEDAELQAQIARDLKELDGLIHAQLTAAKLEAGSTGGQLERIELDGLLEEVVDLFPQARQRIDCPGASEPVTCEGDARSLRTLFRNLLENALKYSETEKPVQISARYQEGHAVVSVIDQGMGIAEGEHPLIFEPFYRGTDRRKTQKVGFGLGLALCQRIVRAHGGELKVDSVVGKGTTIRVLLPLTFPPVAIDSRA